MLDGQTHLVKQGWRGAGHPLKAGGRSRPIVIAQKKTLGGIGKDRDESFAFWDHLYDVAAKTIKLKLPGDESPADSDQETGNSAIVRISLLTFLPNPYPSMQQVRRTQTGILSNRRPTNLPTPSSSKSPSPPPSSGSIISLAKKEAARRVLYSRFLRGPVITQETLESSSTTQTQASTTIPPSTSASVPPISLTSTKATSTKVTSPPDTQIPNDDKNLKKAEKAARRLAREERRKAKAARREAREERRKAKLIRDEARAAKEKRKIERAAKRAAKLARKQGKEHHKTQVQENTDGPEVPTLVEVDINEEREKSKKEKKRKRDKE
ncbi:unnamed protein product [Rhizoctonia solani]|uniref:G-patch domain-containing protein n=1 Tax=Rhizoctonia solani TaxID=456999 RepID=A0A8H3AQY1_9AGAM|nr:unnamed protein product [Rhizoctonia solani]